MITINFPDEKVRATHAGEHDKFIWPRNFTLHFFSLGGKNSRRSYDRRATHVEELFMYVRAMHVRCKLRI